MRLKSLALTALILAIPAAAVITFTLWYLAQGFIPWTQEWWSWLIASAIFYRDLPAGMFWPLIFFLVVVGSTGMATTLFRLSPGGTTIFGGVKAADLHGSAKWADRKEIKAASLMDDAGVTVGGFKGDPLRHNGPEHILAFAPTRSGKGISLVVPTLLEWQESVVVLDIKGENYALTAGYRKSLGHRILRFEPTALEGSIRFNPLGEIRLGTDYEPMDCQNIAAMIIDPDGKGLKDFWMQSSFEWLSVAILHVLYRVKKEEKRTATLADANTILSAAAFLQMHDPLEAMLDDIISYDHGRESVNNEVRRVASKMKGRAPPERSGVHSSSMTQLSLYADPIIAKNISKSDFKLDDLMNGDKPAAFYIIIPPSDIDRLRPLVRVLFNIMLRRLTAEMSFDEGRSVKSYKNRLLLMLDEFTSIGKLDIFEKALAFMAGYGLKCYIIVQDLTQLQQTYSREESIMSNCHVRIAFAPNKIETAKTLSDMIGSHTVIQKKRSSTGGWRAPSVSDSISETGRQLLRPDEIMKLPGPVKNAAGEVVRPGKMVILAAGFNPILGDQRLYFHDEELLKRVKKKAPGPIPEAAAITPSYMEMLDAGIKDPSQFITDDREDDGHETAA